METEHKILHSGIFKIDGKSNPIGIVKLTAKKSLFKGPSQFIPYQTIKLREMILDISFAITKREKTGQKGYSLNDLLIDFAKEFELFLDGWELSPKILKPHYDGLVNKAKKHIRKNELLLDYEKMVIRSETKNTARRDFMVYQIHNIFKEYTGIKVTDTLRYITYLLSACGIEIEFENIKKIYQRYIKPKS